MHEYLICLQGWRFIIPDLDEYGDNHTRVRLESVTLFDNTSYKKLRTIEIDHCVKLGTSEQPTISLDLDRDILLIRVRTTSKTRTLIWRLLETFQEKKEQKTEEILKPEKEEIPKQTRYSTRRSKR